MKKIITFGLLLFLGSTQLKAESPSRTVWASQTSLLDNNLYSFAHGNASLAAVSKSGIGNTIKSCSILSNFTIDDINYVFTSPTTVEVGLNPNASGDIVIPATVTIDGSAYSVTSIGFFAFSSCYGLTSVTIPNSVTTIGYGAFSDCTSLTSVTIPNSVTTISGSTFAFCSSLTSVTIPNSVTSIGQGAFVYCTSLTSVTIPNSVISIDRSAFQVCSSLTMVIIPNSVTGIGEAAFSSCFGLTSVTIGNSLTSLGAEAFGECTSLTSVTCNVTSPITISTNVFANVNQAACSLTVPSGSVAAYEAAAVWQDFNPIITFVPVFNTTTVTACASYYTWTNTNQTYTSSGVYTGTTTNGVTEQLDLTIVDTNFSVNGVNYYITSPTTVEVGNNSGASGDIVIPATVTNACGTYSVTTIGYGAFIDCTSLTSVTIPNSVTSIGFFAFSSCYGLTSVTIPNSVTNIGHGAFSDCTSLTSVTIPNSVTTISVSTFAFCYSLTSVTIPNSVTSIGQSAFVYCTSLTSVTIPNSVISIDHGAFQVCTSLTSVAIPNSVTTISGHAFSFCSSLTSVTIPNSVTSIGEYAFANCTSLTSVICNVTSPISISANVFANVNQAACSLSVPTGSVAAYQAALVWQDFRFPNNNLSIVIDSQCGATLPEINTLIRANAITGASHYRFKVINGATIEIIEPTSGRWFRLTSFPGVTFYNTTYTISVAVKRNNVWGEYGDACAVTTPAFPATKVRNSQCGVTLASLATTISANPVSRASGYRFKVVNGATTEIIEAVSGVRWFRLTSLLGGVSYNTTYTVSVATQYNGVWGDYGDECIVITPAFSTTKVQDSQCGVTLASIATFISADAVSRASGYRFKVVNGATNEIIEAVSGSRWFRLTSLSGGALYNTTYTISAASKYNGVWSNYGVECDVTTPSAPTSLLTKLQTSQCGITLASDNTNELYANAVSVAQKYRFEVSFGADVHTYETASSSVRSFRMTEVSGLTLERGTTYAVRVSIMVNGVWQPYGASCTVTTYTIPSNVVRTINLDTTNFDVVTYPNPFTDNFNLNLTSISEEKVTVMVYDMTGKLLERKEVVPSELTELQVGNNFASGVYNVIVSQGTNTKSLRVIKK